MLKNILFIGLTIVSGTNLFACQERCKIVSTGAGAVGTTAFGYITWLAFQRQYPCMRNLPYRPDSPFLGSITGTMAIAAFVYTANNVRKCMGYGKNLKE